MSEQEIVSAEKILAMALVVVDGESMESEAEHDEVTKKARLLIMFMRNMGVTINDAKYGND